MCQCSCYFTTLLDFFQKNARTIGIHEVLRLLLYTYATCQQSRMDCLAAIQCMLARQLILQVRPGAAQLACMHACVYLAKYVHVANRQVTVFIAHHSCWLLQMHRTAAAAFGV